MLPNKIKDNFIILERKECPDDCITKGILTCCNMNSFEVLVFGKQETNLFSRVHFYTKEGMIIIKAKCKKCGKTIPVFNSSIDGYEKCGEKQFADAPVKGFFCPKCNSTLFHVGIKYEYPGIEELDSLGISEKDNAFTWIRISLECNSCKAKYIHFLDYEAG